MSNTRITQGQKVIIGGGNTQSPAGLAQGHKIIVGGGNTESPAAIAQAHKIIVSSIPFVFATGRKRAAQIIG